jgi:hypothetical protein
MTILDKHFPPNLLSNSVKGDPGMSVVGNKFQLHYKTHEFCKQKKKIGFPKSMGVIGLFVSALQSKTETGF